jgi:hypothetical protein
MITLEEFTARPYPIIVSEKQSKICIFVPKLHLFAESDSLQSAYQALNNEKIAFYNRLSNIDSLHLIPELLDEPQFLKRLDLQKIIVERGISFVLTLVFWILILSIVGHQINKAGSKLNEAFVPVTPEKQQERMLNFKAKLDVVSPYWKEIKKALNE